MKKFFITTPIYYVNAKPHIGHAYTSVAADVLARFHRTQNQEAFLLMGTDEHGLKIQKKAEERRMEPQKFVDEISSEFKKHWGKLGIQYGSFIRTTDRNHIKAVQSVLQALFDSGAIYRGKYEGLYCVGCEQFKSENELVNGRCPDHDMVLEKVQEECYLLKMGSMQSELIEKIEKDEFQIKPEKYKKEILSFLQKEKLKDISISRKNIPWGVPLPFDSGHTTYVWFDAFLSYLTGLNWEGNPNVLPDMWPVDIQLIGKEILRVHATIWPVIMMHLGIPLPKLLFVHGHIISGGRKMSKTVGNVISIDEMIGKFGADGTRYLLMSAGTFGEDVDVTMERLIEKYNADLANGIGNLVSRVVKLNAMSDIQIPAAKKMAIFDNRFLKCFATLELNSALNFIWKIVSEDNKIIEDSKPWELVKNDKSKFKEVMQKLFFDLRIISDHLVPFLPETSEKIKKALEENKAEVLFPRIR